MEDPIITKIKRHFDIKGNPAEIPLMNGKKLFTARLEEDGIYVDNLGNQPFLPWEVFSEAINCLKENGGEVKKGNAMNSRLGDSKLDLNTMEGYIASKVFGYTIGDSVFRRITPIASILAWAEICENSRGQISLISEKKELEAFENGEKVPLAPPDNNEIKESSETSPVSVTFDSRNNELRNLEIKLVKSLERIKELEESISIKDKDLETLAEKVIAATGEIRKTEEKLIRREKKINNLEVAFATSEEKVKKLEKQLSVYKGEKELAVQLREKEELIRQLKGTLACKEEEFSRLNEENRKYKRQQKFESDGLKQIEEQKASKKWWKHW